MSEDRQSIALIIEETAKKKRLEEVRRQVARNLMGIQSHVEYDEQVVEDAHLQIAEKEEGMKKLTPNERYEIRAETFRLMTRHMAPGKDVSPAAYCDEYDVRRAAWEVWQDAYEHAVNAAISAVENLGINEGGDAK